MATEQHLKEMRDLVEAGDLSFANAREAFKRANGRDTTLTDDQILKTWADDVNGDWADDADFSAELLRRETTS